MKTKTQRIILIILIIIFTVLVGMSLKSQNLQDSLIVTINGKVVVTQSPVEKFLYVKVQKKDSIVVRYVFHEIIYNLSLGHFQKITRKVNNVYINADRSDRIYVHRDSELMFYEDKEYFFLNDNKVTIRSYSTNKIYR